MRLVEEDCILTLYTRYIDALRKVRENQQKLYDSYSESLKELRKHYISRLVPQKFLGRTPQKFLARTVFRSCRMALLDPHIDDIEAEITYLLIRAFRPKTLVEVSPLGGWSTSWILNAVKDNNWGTLYSYDLVDDSSLTLPQDLVNSNWIFVKGDVRKRIHELPSDIDYLLMDAAHSSEFAVWYIENVFPNLKDGAIVGIHDVFRKAEPEPRFMEGKPIQQWLERNHINYVTAAPAKNYPFFTRIVTLRDELGIHNAIHGSTVNPMVFFRYTLNAALSFEI
ncbi:MAG: class I SAM-dependent methyltransferase [Halobacteriota archaeon]